MHSGLKPIQTLQKIKKIVLQCYIVPLKKVYLVPKLILAISNTSSNFWLSNLEYQKTVKLCSIENEAPPINFWPQITPSLQFCPMLDIGFLNSKLHIL